MIGLPLNVLLTYETVFQISTLFHHSNVKLPFKLERLLIYAIATPRLHTIHHSINRSERDSNYDVIFIWWDFIHGTLNFPRFKVAAEIGVPGFEHPLRFTQALLLPLRASSQQQKR